MDPNIFGTNQEWFAGIKRVLIITAIVVIAAVASIAFGIGVMIS